MRYWNRRLKEMTEYVPGEQPADLETYIKLNTNENPFPPSEAVLAAIREAANPMLRRYPDSTATPVRKTFAEANGLLPENVFVANGSDEIFTLLFRGFIDPEGVALFPYPSYSLYYTLAEANGVTFKITDLNDDFSYNLDRFLEVSSDLIIIANPNNPTGTGCDIADIRRFLKTYRGLLVVDEAYIDFGGESAIGLVGEFDNIIVTRSFSKSYSLAGLRVGLAIASTDIIRGFIKLKDSYNVDSLAIAGARAALLDRRTFESQLAMIRNNRDYLIEGLESLGFSIVPSKANFLLVRHASVSSEDIYERLKEKKILVRYFRGRIVDRYVRISVGTMMEIKTLLKELRTITEA